MNERIRELAKEAGAIHIHGKPKDRALVGYHNIEKFAELIVLECAKKIERDYKYVKGTDTKWNTAFSIACDLKEHFGVEE